MSTPDSPTLRPPTCRRELFESLRIQLTYYRRLAIKLRFEKARLKKKLIELEGKLQDAYDINLILFHTPQPDFPPAVRMGFQAKNEELRTNELENLERMTEILEDDLWDDE